MGIRDRKTGAQTAGTPNQPHPVKRDYAESIQRRAENLTEAVVYDNNLPGKESLAEHQRRQVEQQMARLRSEAVQVRRLGQNIDNLSQDAAARKRKKAMTDSSTVAPGHAQSNDRKTGGKQGTGGKHLNFNPLHPSMELPPEQLIRLLGVTSKKIRKKRKPQRSRVEKAEPSTPAKQAQTTPAKTTRRNPNIQYERNEAPVFENKRSGLLIPSIAVGAIVGISASAYLFWYQPSSPDKPEVTTPVITSQPANKKPKDQPLKRGATPEIKTTPKATGLSPVATPDAALKPAPTETTQVGDSAEWRTAVKGQEKDLRRAAEQRLSERLEKIEAMRKREVAEPTPINDIERILPVNRAAQPETDSDQQGTSAIQPDTDSEQPSTPAAQSETDFDQPDTSIEQPDTGSDQPSTPAEQTGTGLYEPFETEPVTSERNSPVTQQASDAPEPEHEAENLTVPAPAAYDSSELMTSETNDQQSIEELEIEGNTEFSISQETPAVQSTDIPEQSPPPATEDAALF